MPYDSVNESVLRQIPPTARSVLDVGCGTGSLGARVKTNSCRVVGITFDHEEARIASSRLVAVIVADLNNLETQPLGTFDCVVCSHVLEHLHHPDVTLGRLRACLAPGGTLLIAVPNVLYWKQRLQFLQGRFTYTDGGTMDRTHYRFFDWSSARQLPVVAGLELQSCTSDGGFPLSRALPTPLRTALDRKALRLFPGLFGWQFVLTCRLPDRPSSHD